jgi:drug/metabolite transporter (DMT)-like permease
MVTKPQDDVITAEAAIILLLFSATAASLLLVNKLVMFYIPLPSFVSTLQFVVTAIFSYGWVLSGNAPLETWEWKKVKAYLYYTGMFVGSIYSNMKALQHANVETIIVFRSVCPLVVAIIEWGFMDRQLPSPRSWLALLVLVVGCAGYVLTDRAFEINGFGAYTWATAYFMILSVEMAYGKHIVGPHLDFASMWGPTLYTNAISTPVMLSIGLLTDEPSRLVRVVWTPWVCALLLLSCVIGVAISYLGWKSRQTVTASCYTVVGVANKMATVLANVLIWDQHASVSGILFLMLCLAGAVGYQQPPKADEATAASQRPKRIALACTFVLCLIGAVVVLGLSSGDSRSLPPARAPSLSPSSQGCQSGGHTHRTGAALSAPDEPQRASDETSECL